MHRYSGLALGVSTMLALAACNNQHKTADQSEAMTATPSITTASLPKVMLGVRMGHAGPALAKQLGVDPDRSTLITYVAEDTPAQRAGFEQWDIITKVKGAPDASPASIRNMLRSSQPGESVTFTVLRADETITLTAVLEESDSKRMIPLPSQPPTSGSG